MKIHALLAVSAIYLARPRRVNGIESVFPNIVELIQYGGDFGGVSVVVHKDNDACIVFDESGQRRPRVAIRIARHIRHIEQATLAERLSDTLHIHTVAVSEEEGDNLPRMLVEPPLDAVEVGEQRTTVVKEAVGVAEVEGGVCLRVYLTL